MLNKTVKPIWLASYPKSGNTWTRLFFTALLQENELNINEMKTDGIISSRLVIDSTLGMNSAEIPERDLLKYKSSLFHKWAENHVNKEYLLVKVHDSCVVESHVLFPPAITRGLIYILRNPFDMVASTANHHNVSIDKAVKMICSNKHALASKPTRLTNQLGQHLGTWSQHVESWTNVHRNNMLLIKYEDMLHDGLATFTKVVDYVGLDYSQEQIAAAIEEVSFNKIQQQEQKSKFKETPSVAERFFRNGKSGGWRNEITEEHVNRIIDCNYEVLLKYGYIDKEGAILV